MKNSLLLIFIAVLFAIAAGCDNNPFKVDDLTLANEAYSEKNLPLTERLLERCLRNEQNSEKRWQAWNLLLKAINTDRQYPRASLECLYAMRMEFEEDFDKMAQILPLIGKYSRMSRYYDRAAEAWNSYLELGNINNAQRINGFRQLAAMQFAQKHYDAAADTLQQCLSLPFSDHEKIECMLDLAEQNMMLEHWQDVADLCQQILDSDPVKEIYGKACFLRGDALEQMGRNDEAFVLFEQAKAGYPNLLVIENRLKNLKKKNIK